MVEDSLKNIRRNTACDPLRRFVDRALRQMRVARRGLDITMAEELADHWQGFAERQRPGREGMP